MTKFRLFLLAFVLSPARCGSSGAGGAPPTDAGRGDVASSGRDATPAPAADGGAAGAAGQDAMPLPIADGGGGSGGEDAAPTSGADAGTDNKVSPPDASNAALFPVRLVIFYTPLGTVLDSWRPTTTAQGDFSLTGILKPLQPFKERILLVDGIDDLSGPGVPTTDANGAAMLLTGKMMGASLVPTVGRASPNVAFPSIYLGVQSTVSVDFDPTPLTVSNNPGTMAHAIFGQRPDLAAPFSNTDDFGGAGRQQMDLVKRAIQYDETRAITLSWSDVHGDTLFSWVAGVDKDYRTLATNSGVAGPDRDHFIAVQTWFAEQFAYLLNALASTPEGTGTSLLDHTLVVWVSETGEASAGTGKNIPVVIAGNLLGRFRNGAYVKTTGSQASLLSTISQVAIKMPFGDPALGNQPIAALLTP
jgi:hypothetical protein